MHRYLYLEARFRFRTPKFRWRCLSYFEPPSTDQMVQDFVVHRISNGDVRVDLNAFSLQFVCHETMPYFTLQSEGVRCQTEKWH